MCGENMHGLLVLIVVDMCNCRNVFNCPSCCTCDVTCVSARLAAIPYTVKVVTGDSKDCGTEANAWIKVYGHKNRHTGRLHLELAQKKGFEAGSIETFSIEAPDIKEVKAIEVRSPPLTSLLMQASYMNFSRRSHSINRIG